MRKQDSTFTPKEIATFLNNAVAASLRPNSLGEIPQERLRRLHEIAQALIEPLLELLDEDSKDSGLIRPEEAVCILAAAALFVHLKEVMGTDKLPLAGVTDALYGKK